MIPSVVSLFLIILVEVIWVVHSRGFMDELFLPTPPDHFLPHRTPFNSGFQLSVELTNVFGGAVAAVSIVKDLINFS